MTIAKPKNSSSDLLQKKFYRCFLLQVKNINLATNLGNYYFYVMLIASKCMPLCKKLDYDAKSEPPYLATTQIKAP
jgi:hypothetical protein